MQIEVDPLSSVPIYQQLRDRVVEGVADGGLVAGDQLSSVRQLAVDFGINVATVAKAYDVLRREGIIRTTHKSGSVVARDPRDAPADDGFADEWTARLTTLLAEGVVRGLSDGEIAVRTAGILDRFAASRAGTILDKELNT